MVRNSSDTDGMAQTLTERVTICYIVCPTRAIVHFFMHPMFRHQFTIEISAVCTVIHTIDSTFAGKRATKWTYGHPLEAIVAKWISKDACT